jgi:hypothetical protein
MGKKEHSDATSFEDMAEQLENNEAVEESTEEKTETTDEKSEDTESENKVEPKKD